MKGIKITYDINTKEEKIEEEEIPEPTPIQEIKIDLQDLAKLIDYAKKNKLIS
jgi:hypothetical protein